MLNRAFLRKISGYISDNRLLDKGGKYLVALSGGADSVALALAMKELGYVIEAAHCNFHLRGDESVRDEHFCQSFCSDNGIPLHVAHFDTVGFAKLRKISIEMAARHLRYAYFEQLMSDIGAESTCVAHHRDDSVETVLLNLIRGTGINGLTGIKPRNGRIVRPLLCVSRRDIEDALRQVGQSFVTDSTNLVDDVVRNKIRLDILPMMKAVNPSVSESIAQTARRVGEVAEAFGRQIDEAVGHVAVNMPDGTLSISIERLKAGISPENVLFRLLKDYSFSPSQISQVYAAVDAEPGRVFYSSTHQLLIDRGRIIVEPSAGLCFKPVSIPETGTYIIGGNVRLRFECVERDNAFTMHKDKAHCYADLSKITFPLTVRRIAQGDRFKPLGMNGSKLVSDYLTDNKLNLFDKRRQLALVNANGDIVWLVNQRPDNRYRITDNTKNVLIVSYEDVLIRQQF